MNQQPRAYWVIRPGVGTIAQETTIEQVPPGHSLLRTRLTGISVGTERLVGLGLVPAECAEVMACAGMSGSFALPIKYGYCLVGEGIAGRWQGRRVFVMHPHQDLAMVADSAVTELPDQLPDGRATLIPNYETALNAVWDAELVQGERCVVFGAGSVGLAIAHVLSQLGFAATVVDVDARRLAMAQACPWIATTAVAQSAPRASYSVAFHCTGKSEGLDAALASLSFEGRVIDLSWYGGRPVSLQLGSHFHHARLRIIASQVGTVARSHRSSHDKRQRLAVVLRMLEDSALDRLLGTPQPFASMPDFMAQIYRGDAPSPLPLISFP